MGRGIREGEDILRPSGYPRARRVQRVSAPQPYQMSTPRDYARKAQAEDIPGPWTFTEYLLMKAGPQFDVKAWGAKGDNSHDDTKNINAAVQSAYDNSEAGIVVLPPLGSGANDRYKITGPIDWKGGGCFLGSGYYSRISAHVSNGAFPIIQSVAGAAATQQGVWMKGLTLGYEDYYDDVDAKCIAFIDGDPYPRNFTIEDVTLRNGYYGYYDSTGGFLGHLRRVYAYQNRVGFYKHGGGSGHHYDTCFAQGKDDPTWDLRGFDIDAGVAYVIEACAMDWYKSPINGIALFANNHVLTINGFSMEGCEPTGAGYPVVLFDENHGTHVTGMKEVSCVLKAAAADNARLVALYKERIHFSGCELGAGTIVIAEGAAAEGYAIDILGETGTGKSRVTITGGAVVNPAAGPTRTATTISFDSATKEIRDSAEGLNRFATGIAITVSGSVSNDGAYTIATGGVGAKIVVNEALSDEGAGASVTVKITDLPDVYAIRSGGAADTVELSLDNLLEGTLKNAYKNPIRRPRDGESQITVLPLSWVSIGQGTWSLSTNVNSYTYNYFRNSTLALDDNISYMVDLAPGTYTFMLLCHTDSAAGIADIDLDGVGIATFDCYSAATVWNVRKIQTGIVIAEGGPKTLLITMDDKHASSSSYGVYIVYMVFWRTA